MKFTNFFHQKNFPNFAEITIFFPIFDFPSCPFRGLTTTQLVDKIPPITFDDVFNKKIQCGLRKITNDIVEEDEFGDSVTIDPIEAILYVSSPKSGDSVKINGFPR